MISVFEGIGAGFRRKETSHGPTMLPVAAAAIEVFLDRDNRDLWTIAAEVGCTVELLLSQLENLSEERAKLKRFYEEVAS